MKSRVVVAGMIAFLAVTVFLLGEPKARAAQSPTPSPSVTGFYQYPVEKPVAGSYLRAFMVAYARFIQLPQIPEKWRPLENYNVTLSKDADRLFVVVFAPKRAPGEPLSLGCCTSLGRSAYFWIDGNYKIVKYSLPE